MRNLLLPLLFLVGCENYTGSVGELGRIVYGLSSDYEVDDVGLSGALIVTGHPQRIMTSLTSSGEGRIREPGEVSHRVTPVEGALLEHSYEDDGIADFDLTVELEGVYTVESLVDGNVVDRIDLTFGTPSYLDLITWIREPNEEGFDDVTDEGTPVPRYTQVAFVPVPMGEGEQRLVGDISVETSASPEGAIITGSNVYGVFEQIVLATSNPPSIYLVEPGAVSITVSDVPNGVDAVRDFEVVDE